MKGRGSCLFLILAGCGGGKGSLVVSVESAGIVRGGTSLHVTLENSGQSAVIDYSVAPPRDIAPGSPLTLSVVLPADRRGRTAITVEARAGADVLASGSGTFDAQPGVAVHVTITLGGAASGDLATGGPAGLAMASSCDDRVKNGSETDVDCGGSCPRCANGNACSDGTDCASALCANRLCAVPTCTDTVKNGNETDVDCGGTRPSGCAEGEACSAGTDCASGVCAQGRCGAGGCPDQIKNAGERDVDGGGPCPARCADTKACAMGGDRQSGVCAASQCAAPVCNDQIKNGKESDVDCGGVCMTRCADGKTARRAPTARAACAPEADAPSRAAWIRRRTARRPTSTAAAAALRARA